MIEMRAEDAIFTMVTLRPHRIQELIRKLPNNPNTIYKAVHNLKEKKLVIVERTSKEAIVRVSSGFLPQKMRELFTKSLSYGIDPNDLLTDSFERVIHTIRNDPKTIHEVMSDSGLSYQTVYSIFRFLTKHNLAKAIKQKPLILKLDQNHEIVRLLFVLMRKEFRRRPVFEQLVEELPFDQYEMHPDDVERILYDNIDKTLHVEGTKFITRGEGKLEIISPQTEFETREEKFLRYLMTPEGVEDFCILLLASKEMNYSKLLQLAEKRRISNVVGCYLDILHDISPNLVPKEVVERFHTSSKKVRRVFLKELKKYGKEKWSEPYERKWSLKLYLNRDAILHGVRAFETI